MFPHFADGGGGYYGGFLSLLILATCIYSLLVQTRYSFKSR